MTTREYSLFELQSLKGRLLPLLAGVLGLLLIVWVVAAPAESRLGSVVKLVYVHGALVWAGLLTFSLAGFLGLVALALRLSGPATGRAAPWLRGARSAGLAALVVWIVYVLSSMAVTGLTWGQWIAWGEPRVRATAAILVAALALNVVVRLVDHPDLTALVQVLMGIAPWVVVSRAQAIRHPVDPIGGSTSTSIQGFYLLIVVTVIALALTLVAWLWAGAELAPERRRRGPGPDHDRTATTGT
ncbi:MAG: hypothetical protein GX597_09930 [Anaerolineaceae bacterium]|nr:hypothetical protein [Anaerolineaceae bacterium]